MFGQDKVKVMEHVGTRTQTQIKQRLTDFKKKVLKYPDTEGSYIIPILKGLLVVGKEIQKLSANKWKNRLKPICLL